MTALRRGFVAETSAGEFRAQNVVVATGPFQRPIVPPLLPETPGILQLHASAYKSPGQLPEGAVLVVGAGASGAQIADELMRAGRRVYFSVGKHKRAPRRYRGHDHVWWWIEASIDQTPPERRPADRSPIVHTGAQMAAFFDHALRDRVLRFDRACAALYGEIRSAREAAGRPISAADAMIAATARAYGATFIATRNTRDFALCGVGLVDPWRAA